MFFKQSEKNEPAESNTSPLFSMEKIGFQIMHARKKKGMTQMELADRLGISFQAVSNWERGLSCPDISKLFELSELFDVSIDELLGNKRAAQIATEIQDGTPPALPVEELTAVAPLLDQAQADQVMQKSLLEDSFRLLEESTQASSHASSHASAQKKEASSSSDSQEVPKDRMDAIISLLPYASEETVGELAMTILNEKHDLEQIRSLLPFMNESAVGEMAKKHLEATHDLEQIRPLLPFMYENAVDEIAKKYLEATHDLEQIKPLLPFMDESAVGEMAKKHLEATHNLEQIRPLLPFMDEGAVDELLRSFFK